MGGPGTLGREEAIEAVLQVAPHLEIAHQVPGRIRLRIFASGMELVQDLDAAAATASIPGVRDIRVNPFARSIVIEYAPTSIPADVWTGLAELRHRPDLKPAVEERLRRLWDAREAGRRPDPDATG